MYSAIPHRHGRGTASSHRMSHSLYGSSFLCMLSNDSAFYSVIRSLHTVAIFSNHRKHPKRMFSQSAPSLSTLPIELVYRIIDHLQPYDILVAAYSICTRWNLIIDTYQPYQVKLVSCTSRNSSLAFAHRISRKYLSMCNSNFQTRDAGTFLSVRSLSIRHVDDISSLSFL